MSAAIRAGALLGVAGASPPWLLPDWPHDVHTFAGAKQDSKLSKLPAAHPAGCSCLRIYAHPEAGGGLHAQGN